MARKRTLTIDDERKRKLVAMRTLRWGDGREAVISGAMQPFATVSRWPADGLSVEYAWATVDHIARTGGVFRSGDLYDS